MPINSMTMTNSINVNPVNDAVVLFMPYLLIINCNNIFQDLRNCIRNILSIEQKKTVE
jgi:hypothetical protein